LDNEKVIGTNCYNCLFISKTDIPIQADKLKDQGEIGSKADIEPQTVKAPEPITSPHGSRADVLSKRFCTNLRTGSYINRRYCDRKGV